MPAQVNSIPAGYHSATPYLTLNNAARALDFYKRVFGAEEVTRMDGPDGKIAHAEIKIGDSIIMLGDEMPGTRNRSPESLGGTTAGVMLYVDNADAVFNKAVSEGAQVESALADMFWGDRYGKLIDPFGHSWGVATHQEDVAPAEMEKRMQEAMAQHAERTQSAH